MLIFSTIFIPTIRQNKAESICIYNNATLAEAVIAVGECEYVCCVVQRSWSESRLNNGDRQWIDKQLSGSVVAVQPQDCPICCVNAPNAGLLIESVVNWAVIAAYGSRVIACTRCRFPLYHFGIY